MPYSLAIKDPASASNCSVTQRPDNLYQTSGYYNCVNIEATQCFSGQD